MKVVMTGATGHVGFALLKELLSRVGEGFDKPTILIRKDIPLFDGLDVEKRFGDVTDYDSLVAGFEGADVVFHLAGMIELKKGNDEKTYKVNVDGTKNVVKACQACHVKRLVYMGSVDTYEPLPGRLVMSEKNHFDPDFLEGTYAKTKALATNFVLANNGVEGLETIVMQPSACIGPYDFKVSAVGIFVRMYMAGLKITMNFGGYNFVDVRDVAIATANAATMGKCGECYILGGDHFYSVEEFTAAMSEARKMSLPKVKLGHGLVSGIAPIMDAVYTKLGTTALLTPYSVRKLTVNGNFSIEKAKKELDYSPRPLVETVGDMMDWIDENEGKQTILGCLKK